jgi:hypothetical protein
MDTSIAFAVGLNSTPPDSKLVRIYQTLTPSFVITTFISLVNYRVNSLPPANPRFLVLSLLELCCGAIQHHADTAELPMQLVGRGYHLNIIASLQG